MIVLCPYCSSENVTNPSVDSNDFICNDCCEDFKADNGIDLDKEDEKEESPNSASLIDLTKEAALNIAKQLRKEKEDDSLAE